ncbi:MAG: metallophosphoesterase family protein [Planctomycetota bacterium]|jgi:3',5'-cyclic AMP phosphodiesterase CpdA
MSVTLAICAFMSVLAGASAGAEKKAAPAPRAARRGSEFKAAVARQGDLFTITWTEPLGGGKDFLVLTGPYIGWLTATEATVGWEVIGQKKVTAKPYASLKASYDMENIKFRWARLEKLEPGKAYRYKLVCGHYTSEEISFRTMPAKGDEKLRFDVIGDTQRYGSTHTEVNRKLYKLIEEDKVPLLLHVGDLIYGGSGYHTAGRKSWFRVLHMMKSMRASTFMALAPGNHDLHHGNYPWAPDYFGDVPAAENAAGRSRPPFYYSFDAGNVHFVALSTETRRSHKGRDLSKEKWFSTFTYDEQLAWLEEDLKSASADWTVCFFHQPLHTVGGYSVGPGIRKDFGELFDKYKVPLIFSGHDHSYQRTRRIVNSSRELSETGTVQVISAGASNFFAGKTAPWNVRYDKTNHYLRVEVDGATLTVEAVDVEGQVFDRWRLKRTGQPEKLPLPEKKAAAQPAEQGGGS